MGAGSPRSSAPEASRGGAAPGVPLVAGARLPLAFIAVALAGYLGASAWLAASPGALLLPHVHPEVVALAHLWLPGFLLSACMGAMYQLVPVVLGTPLRGGDGMWVHLAAHVAGLVLLVHGLGSGRFDLAAAGGALVSIGAFLLAFAVLRTFAAATRRDVAAWCFPVAASWLVLTVLAGVALALLRRWPVLPFSPLGWLRAHAHLGLIGFFLTLLQGTTFQLVPMFTMGVARRQRTAALGLAASQAGLLALALGLGAEWRIAVTAGAVLVVAGIGCSAVAFAATLQTRRRRHLEPGLQAFVLGTATIAVAAVAGLALLALPAGAMGFRGALSYGIIILVGALSLTVLGMLAKIIPFLVWMRTYGPRVGRQPVPAATALPSRTLEKLWLGLHLSALPLLTAAPLLESRTAAGVGALLLAAGAAVYVANAARIFSHLWNSAALSPPQPALS